MMRILPVLFLFLLLAGCSLIQLTPDPARQKEQKKFIIAYDEFAARDDITGLQNFISDYPDSLWAVRAAAVVSCIREAAQLRDQLKAQLATQRSSAEVDQSRLQDELQKNQTEQQQLREQQQRLKREVDQQSALIKQLKQQNQQLNEQLEKLKALLIELERRPQ